MKIIKKSAMPDGTKIQVERWNEYGIEHEGTVYPVMTLGAYPIAKRSMDGSWMPKKGKPFRLAFDFWNAKECMDAFEALKKGERKLTDFAEKAAQINLYYEAVGERG